MLYVAYQGLVVWVHEVCSMSYMTYCQVVALLDSDLNSGFWNSGFWNSVGVRSKGMGAAITSNLTGNILGPE